MSSKMKLQFSHFKKVRITLDFQIPILMRALFYRKRIISYKRLYRYYQEAFSEFLLTNRVPKQVPKLIRRQMELECTPDFVKQLESLRAIAKKRQQPLAVVIEEALWKYLEKPENYLGKDEYPKQRMEKIL